MFGAMLNFAQALRTHLILSGIFAAVGLVCFLANNHTGTRRSRRHGYWIFGCGMLFFQGCSAPYLLNGMRTDQVHPTTAMAGPLWPMVFGLIVGAVAGKLSGRAVFPDDGPDEPGDTHSAPPRS